MHPDRIGVGIDADQQDGGLGIAAVRQAYGLSELLESLEHGRSGSTIVAAVRGTAAVTRIRAAEMIDTDLEKTRRRVGCVGHAFPEATQFDRFPLAQRLRDIEHRARIRATRYDDGGRHAQDIIDDAAQTAVGARRDVDGVETPTLNERLRTLSVAKLR